MKQNYFILLAVCLLGAAPIFAQNGTTKLQIAKAIVQYPLGSTSPNLTDSTTYTYDNMGRYTENKRWYWFSANAGTVVSRIIDFSYNANGNLLGSLRQYADDFGGWEDFEQITNTYDANENRLETLTERFEQPNGWFNHLLHQSTYDSLGNELSSIIYSWMDTAWAINNGLYFTYDAAGRVLTRTTNLQHRITYAYNVEGNLITETSAQFNGLSWVEGTRKKYLYDSQSGLPSIGYTNQLWNGIEWQNLTQQLYTFNGASDIVVALDQTWNSLNSVWTDLSRYLYEYDNQGNETLRLFQEWKNGAWTNVARYVKTYDNDSFILTSSSERYSSNTWKLAGISRYYYADFVSAAMPQHANFELFPNPANTSLTLKGENLAQADIFDLHGHLLHSIHLSGQNETLIPIGQLPAGNYFIRAYNGNGAAQTRLFQACH